MGERKGARTGEGRGSKRRLSLVVSPFSGWMMAGWVVVLICSYAGCAWLVIAVLEYVGGGGWGLKMERVGGRKGWVSTKEEGRKGKGGRLVRAALEEHDSLCGIDA